MKAILIDDDLQFIESFKKQLIQFSTLDLIATFNNFSSAFEWIRQNPVDLILSDIELPDFNAIDGFKSLNTQIPIILISSHPEFAISGYDINAIHFLTKPIEPQKLLQALDRVLGHQNAKGDYYYISHNGKYHKVDLREIIYLKSSENYCDIHFQNGSKKTVLTNMTQLLRQLDSRFHRIHKGYAVNLANIDHFDNEHVSINGQLIPIGNGYKNSFQEHINKYLIKRQLK
jgi:DNA-binding LytR/AlgR family response regulator